MKKFIFIMTLTFVVQWVGAAIYTDNFDRGALGANWTVLGGAATIAISNNKVIPSSNERNCIVYWSANSIVADQFYQIKITSTTNINVGAVCRAQVSSPQCYFAQASATATLNLYIYGAGLYSDGYKLLGTKTVSTPWAIGDYIKGESQGTTIRAIKITGGIGTDTIRVTDATLSSGQPGIRLYIMGSTADDGSGGDLLVSGLTSIIPDSGRVTGSQKIAINGYRLTGTTIKIGSAGYASATPQTMTSVDATVDTITTTAFTRGLKYKVYVTDGNAAVDSSKTIAFTSPGTITYTRSAVVDTLGIAMVNDNASVQYDAPDSFTISPTLVAGLSITKTGTNRGRICGAPTTTSNSIAYSVYAWLWGYKNNYTTVGISVIDTSKNIPARIPTLLLPANKATGVSVTPLFKWSK